MLKIKNLFDFNKFQLQSELNKVEQIMNLEQEYSNYTDEELKNKTLQFKDRLANGETLDDILIEAFATVREASYRILGMKHFEVQLLGGIILHKGNIAEMKTGEGKTLVSTCPSYLNALSGQGVFIITVNEYLAKRDFEEMGQIHTFLGLNVGLISSKMPNHIKKKQYDCDIVYGTNSEFGFDYLRDNMVKRVDQIVQKTRNFAIIDEVDSVLIDEARTPLIISGQGKKPSNYYITVDRFVKSLKNDIDYISDMRKKTVILTDYGMDRVEKFFGLKTYAEIDNLELLHHIRQSLQANVIMKKDEDYVVQGSQVQIVDQFTGRIMEGRRYSNGLHQAIEAKENVEINKENETLATITYQNYFRLFNKISGMTGTAHTDRKELREIYGMDTVVIPTHRPTIRIDKPDYIFASKSEKIKAIISEIKTRHEAGQPILVGTTYINQSEEISNLLNKISIKHNLLNAKQDANEAEIISMAGQKGAVTIATNMAGRGTDIKLGDGVAELGGLFVLGTEKHDSRRVDNQLRGRSGRQGDPGESRFFISLEDTIFTRSGKDFEDKVKTIINQMNIPEGMPIEDNLLSKAVDSVQKDIEHLNYQIRVSTFKFDQILNKQRESLYKERNTILNGESKKNLILSMIKDVSDVILEQYTAGNPYPETWDIESMQNMIESTLAISEKFNLLTLPKDEIENLSKDSLAVSLIENATELYEEIESSIGQTQMRQLERVVLLETIDKKWTEYLDIVEQMRQGIYLQSIGGFDPVQAFNKEAFSLFEETMQEIRFIVITELIRLGLGKKIEQEIKTQDLEEKYRYDKSSVLRVSQNDKKLKFNMNINAVEEVQVLKSLYYMENGIESHINNLDETIIVKGSFYAEFILESPLELGWHQIKIFLHGKESSTFDFYVIPQSEYDMLTKKNRSIS